MKPSIEFVPRSLMVVSLEDSAEHDRLDGYWFYEDQEPGFGGSFLMRIQGRDFETPLRRKLSPTSWFHFSAARRFPHGFYYRIAGETVKVHALLDCRRSPRWIRRQLKGR